MQNTFEKASGQLNIRADRNSEWRLMRVERLNKYQMIRNNFILLLAFNIIDLLGYIFAVSFYQWFCVYSSYKVGFGSVWLSFLCIQWTSQYNPNYKSLAFVWNSEKYDNMRDTYCSVAHPEDQVESCKNDIDILKIMGIIAFSLIILGIVSHLLEILRLVFVLIGKRNKICLKAQYMHPLIVISLSAPLVLFLVCLIYLYARQSGGNTAEYAFGSSFYVAAGMFLLFLIVLFYYKRQKYRLEVHETMDKLLLEQNKCNSPTKKNKISQRASTFTTMTVSVQQESESNTSNASVYHKMQDNPSQQQHQQQQQQQQQQQKGQIDLDAQSPAVRSHSNSIFVL